MGIGAAAIIVGWIGIAAIFYVAWQMQKATHELTEIKAILTEIRDAKGS